MPETSSAWALLRRGVASATPAQRASLLVYWISALAVADGDRRFGGTPWSSSKTRAHACIYILAVTLRWVRRLLVRVPEPTL